MVRLMLFLLHTEILKEITTDHMQGEVYAATKPNFSP